MHHSSEFQKCSSILKTDFLKKRYTEGVFCLVGFGFYMDRGQCDTAVNISTEVRSRIKKTMCISRKKVLLLSEQFYFILSSSIWDRESSKNKMLKTHIPIQL